MAGCAESGKYFPSLLAIARGFCCIRRSRDVLQNLRLSPALAEALHNCIYLLARHHTAFTLGERRHRSSRSALGDGISQGVIVNDRKIHGIANRGCRPLLTIGTVA